MPVVAADPYPVDQPLVIGVHRNQVAPFPNMPCYVYFIVVIMERIPRRRPLADKTAVDVEFVIVVRRDINIGLYASTGLEMPPEQDVGILRSRGGDMGFLQLAVEHVHRLQIAEALSSDPLPLENALYLLLVHHNHLSLSAAAGPAAGNRCHAHASGPPK